MVGFYPDAPGPRMAYDRDGTLGFNVNSTGTSIVALTGTQMQNMNDESGSTAGPTIQNAVGAALVLIFPELRDVTHHFRQFNASTTSSVESSVDTTNGFDGTWLTVNALAASPTADPQPAYRTAQVAAAGNNTSIKAIRFKNGQTGSLIVSTIHLYGKVSAANPNKLELWHPTLDQALYVTPAYLDFGDFPRNSSVDKSFRIKNRSTTLTANTITVSREALTDAASPTHISEETLSYNGGAFGSTASLSSLAPGAISQLFTLRNAPGSTSVLGIFNQRIVATAASWS